MCLLKQNVLDIFLNFFNIIFFLYFLEVMNFFPILFFCCCNAFFFVLNFLIYDVYEGKPSIKTSESENILTKKILDYTSNRFQFLRDI